MLGKELKKRKEGKSRKKKQGKCTRERAGIEIKMGKRGEGKEE